MLEMKVIEIRDAMTCIPAIAIRMFSADPILARYLYRFGYPTDGSSIALMRIADLQTQNDSFDWGSHTMWQAHQWVLAHWNEIQHGQVVDLEFIRGDTKAPKTLEQWEL